MTPGPSSAVLMGDPYPPDPERNQPISNAARLAADRAVVAQGQTGHERLEGGLQRQPALACPCLHADGLDLFGLGDHAVDELRIVVLKGRAQRVQARVHQGLEELRLVAHEAERTGPLPAGLRAWIRL